MMCEVPIDRKEHSFSLLGRVDEMRRDKRYCDFLIKVGSLEIYAHRNILAGGSDYYDKMLSHDTQERESGVVNMKGIDPECASSCIDHLYGGKVFIPDGKFEEMMHAADFMQLHTLREAIENLLQSRLDAKSFFIARRIANLYGVKKLEETCKAFAMTNFSEISEEEEFGELDKNYIKQMTKSKELKMSEAGKLDAVLKWIKHSPERSKFLMEMLKLVTLSEVSANFRRHLIENEPLINKNSECLLHFSISMMDTFGAKPEEIHSSEKKIQCGNEIVIFDKTSGHLQRFNPRNNSFKRMQEMNNDMKQNWFSAVRLQNHVYVLMERKTVYRLEFTDEAASWERRADMLLKHGSVPPAVVLSGDIYVAGACWMIWSSFVEKYHPPSNKWIRLSDKLKETNGAAMIALEGCIYSFGGYDGRSYTDTIEVFSLSSSSWKVIGSMNERKCGASAVEFKGKIYILGGIVIGEESSATLECYDIKTNRCTMLKSMNIACYLHRGFVIDGAIYAVDGHDKQQRNVEKYDVSRNEWEMVKIPGNLKLEFRESFLI